MASNGLHDGTSSDFVLPHQSTDKNEVNKGSVEGDPMGATSDGNEDVEVVYEPKVDLVFSSMNEVGAFYKRYAKAMGFGVTVVQGAYNTAKERRSATWRCECYGYPDMKPNKKSKWKAKHQQDLDDLSLLGNPRRRLSKKVGCTAMIYASWNDARHWQIRKVELEHKNHQPKPSQARLVKEYRMEMMTSTMERKLVSDSAVGASVGQIRASMAHDRGGYENVPLTEADMRHVLNERRRLKMEGGDTNALVAYFDRMQKENRDFFHCHRLDEEGKMKDILWVDPRSRVAYKEFSDVVCFDTTYLTNQYALPFANFVGVNHHGQSILFGCALITSEDCDTFTWVFRQWLVAMDGRAPGGILTDQAAAMRKPLEETMPKTRHRWCIWHILQKLPYKLGYHEKYDDLRDEILDVIHNSLNNLHFEIRWKDLIVKYGLEKNEWLLNLYLERHMWVPSFMTDYFWAGMRSTQRVESINSFFDKFVHRNTLFCEFGEKYTAAVEKRVADEKDADERNEKYFRVYSTGYTAERFFRKIYTSTKFRRVQRECQKVTYCGVDAEKAVDDIHKKYFISDRVWILKKDHYEETLTDGRTFYCVKMNTHTKEAWCSCKMFETHGIICRHIIRLYDKLRVENIPDLFILQRWRKDVVREHTSVKVAFHDLSRTDEVKRHDRLVVACDPITDVGSKTERRTQIVIKGLKLIDEELNEEILREANSEAESNVMSPNRNSEPTSVNNGNMSGSPGNVSGCGQTSGLQSENHVVGILNIKDPPIPKKRGRPRATCYKTYSETGWRCSQGGSQNSGSGSGGARKKSKAPSKPKGKKTAESTTIDSNNDAEEHYNSDEGKKKRGKKKKKVSFADILAESPNHCLSDDVDLDEMNIMFASQSEV